MERKQKISRRTLDINDSLESHSSVSEPQLKKTSKSIESKGKKEMTSVKLKSSSTSLQKVPISKSSSVNKTSNSVPSKSSSVVNSTSKPSGVSSKVSKTSVVLISSSKNEVKTKSSVSKISSRLAAPVGASSPRSKYVKTRDENQTKAGAKPKFTNVTVRSPTRESTQGKLVGNHKIVVNTNKDSNSKRGTVKNNEDAIDMDTISRNHQRYRTRTLEPNEVKVLKSETSKVHDNDLERLSKIVKKDEDKKLFAKPEAFYVPLDEKFTEPPKTKTPTEPESDSDKYEEDFESYESDFESFVSSDEKDSNKSSLHEDSEDSVDDNTEDHHLPANNFNQHDEAHLDSGNYDLKVDVEEGKVDETKGNVELDKIPYTFLKTREVDSAKMPSYLDEGFDENSGGFSSTSNSANARFEETINAKKQNDNESISDARKYKQRLNYYQQRARDLSSLITFDNVEYALFEISPIPYDVFIKTYGKSNVIQRSCQTNDDNVEDYTQTEIIAKQSKWCQFPVEFSKFNIITKSPEKQSKRIYSSYIYNDDTTMHDNQITNMVTEIKPIENPLEIYRSQRLGCTADKTKIESMDLSTLYTDPIQYKKLYNFVDKVGKFMINYLKESSSSDQSNSQTVKSEYAFSEKYTSPLDNVSKHVSYLKNRPPKMLAVCPSNINLLLTVHPKCSKNIKENIEDLIFSRTLVCIWDCTISNITEPSKILLSVDNISCCRFYDGLNGIVVAGTEDGILCSWDLEEHDMWHNLIQGTITDQSIVTKEMKNANNEKGVKEMHLNIDSLIVRCCSFTSFSLDLEDDVKTFYGAVVDILIDKFQKNNIDKSYAGCHYNQVGVLQEYGLLTIWTVIKSKSTTANKFYSDTNSLASHTSQAYWSNLKFHKHLVLNLQETFRHICILNSSVVERKFVKKSLSYQEFPLTDVKRKNSYKRTITPRGASDNQNDSLSFISRTNNGSDFSILNSNTLQNQTSLISNLSGLPMTDWESKLKCLTLKCMYDANGTEHFLVACSSGWILHYNQRGNLQNPQVFICSNPTSQIRSIEISHHNLSYFLAGCDNCVDLFSLSNPKPLKSFFNEKSTENLERFYREEIICIEWSKLRPCLFFTLSNKSRLTVWDLLRSDLVPIISEELKKENDFVASMKLLLDERQIPNKEYIILYYSSGSIEKHNLLKELEMSVHQNKDIEAAVLARYMKLL